MSEAGLTFTDIIQARSFLQLPLAKNMLGAEVDELHVDTDIPHVVVLYYVCDSDGDTLIVDKKYNPEIGVEEGHKYTEALLLGRVTPRKNRAVIFDGAYYHTAEQPKLNVRCVINFDIRKETK
jgi:hypothetical protein